MSSAVSSQCSDACSNDFQLQSANEAFIGSACDAVSEVIDVIVQSLRDVLKRQPSEGLLWDNYGKLCLLIDEIVNEVGLPCTSWHVCSTQVPNHSRAGLYRSPWLSLLKAQMRSYACSAL